jgi:hypothetical protein
MMDIQVVLRNLKRQYQIQANITVLDVFLMQTKQVSRTTNIAMIMKDQRLRHHQPLSIIFLS